MEARRRVSLMVSVLASGSSGPGSSPGRGHCLLGQGTLFSHGLSPPNTPSHATEIGDERQPDR